MFNCDFYSDLSYPRSKRLLDILSLDINRRLNIHGVYSDTTCPGMVVSQITMAILPYYFWILLLPLILIVSVRGMGMGIRGMGVGMRREIEIVLFLASDDQCYPCLNCVYTVVWTV